SSSGQLANDAVPGYVELLQCGKSSLTQALSQIVVIGQLLERPRQAFSIARHKAVVSIAHQLQDAPRVSEGDNRLARVKGLERDVAIGVLTKRQVNHAARVSHQPDLFLFADPTRDHLDTTLEPQLVNQSGQPLQVFSRFRLTRDDQPRRAGDMCHSRHREMLALAGGDPTRAEEVVAVALTSQRLGVKKGWIEDLRLNPRVHAQSMPDDLRVGIDALRFG